MKRLLCYLCLLLAFGFSGIAQTKTYAKSALVVVVAQAKSNFTKGVAYKDWLTTQFGSVKPNEEQDKFLKDVYGFLSNGSNSETVFKNYEGTSLTLLAKTKKNSDLFSQSSARCGFWCTILTFIIEILIELDLEP